MKVKMHRLIGNSDYRGMLRNYTHLSTNWEIEEGTTDGSSKQEEESFLLQQDNTNKTVLLNKYISEAKAHGQGQGQGDEEEKSAPSAANLAASYNLNILFDPTDPSCWEIIDTPLNSDIDEAKFLFYCVRSVTNQGGQATNMDMASPQEEILYASFTSDIHADGEGNSTTTVIDFVSKSFYPFFELKVSYTNEFVVVYGNLVKMDVVSKSPSVTFDPLFPFVPNDKCKYSLIMVDMDHKDPKDKDHTNDKDKDDNPASGSDNGSDNGSGNGSKEEEPCMYLHWAVINMDSTGILSGDEVRHKTTGLYHTVPPCPCPHYTLAVE